jgi:predicted MPP superfamily phosphohydrolase
VALLIVAVAVHVALAAWLLRRRTRPAHFLAALSLPSAALLVGWWCLPLFPRLGLAAVYAFGEVPFFLLLAAARLRRERPWVARAAAGAAVVVLAVALQGFVIEPRWLEVTTFTLTSPKVTGRTRLVLLADFQADEVGAHEVETLRTIAALSPDVLVLSGDYLQVHGRSREAQAASFRESFERLGLVTDRMHIVAVGGDVEPSGWESELFAPGVVTASETKEIEVAGMAFTLLSLSDSANPTLAVPRHQAFHVVVGHRPDFALGTGGGDLLLAGHTHGGQVQVPFIGPILTLSGVPRTWAGGGLHDAAGRSLIVSRGTGLERAFGAPRIRLLCRPQIVVVDLAPG